MTKVKNMHRSKVNKAIIGTGGKGKAIVFGMRSREGQQFFLVISSSTMTNSHHYGKLDKEQKSLAEGIGTAFPAYGTEGQPRACPTTFGQSSNIAIQGPCANDPKGRRQ
jgi:hypothetical protein